MDISQYLAELPDVQPGAIVSRKLEVGEDLRVIGFAFGAGQELTEHTSPMNARIYVVEGSARISLQGDDSVYESGGQADLPANVPHAVAALTDLRMVLVMKRA